MIVVMSLAIILFSLGYKFLMIYGSALLFGILFAAYYPYVFALPKSYNKAVSSKNSATIMIFYAIG